MSSHEAYEHGLRTLAAWLRFLDEKERELQHQMQRARVQEQQDGTGSAAFAWLDESLPRPDAPDAEALVPGGAQPGSPAVGRAQAGAGQADGDGGEEIPDWLRD